jgi:hypothetical protein
MLYEDYEKKLSEVVTDPDNGPVAIPDILVEIKKDIDEQAEAIVAKDNEIEVLKKTVEDRDAKIRDLQDKNTKLFLKLTSDEGGDEPKDTIEDEEITIDDLFKVKED